jgi:hypothetical protein
MKFEPWLKVYGDQAYRGECPLEEAEQATFFSQIRKAHPDTYGRLALHPKNEGKRRGAQFAQLARDKALGMTKSAPDVVLPGSPTLLIEIKRQDHTKSKWQDGQEEYLKTAQGLGCFVAVALGWKGAMEAFDQWVKSQNL